MDIYFKYKLSKTIDNLYNKKPCDDAHTSNLSSLPIFILSHSIIWRFTDNQRKRLDPKKKNGVLLLWVQRGKRLKLVLRIYTSKQVNDTQCSVARIYTSKQVNHTQSSPSTTHTTYKTAGSSAKACETRRHGAWWPLWAYILNTRIYMDHLFFFCYISKHIRTHTLGDLTWKVPQLWQKSRGTRS